MDAVIPDDPVILQSMRRARNIRRVFWVACLWLGDWLGLCLEQAVSWTRSWDGFMNGAITGIVMAPMSLIVLIPLGLIGRAIGSFGPLRPYRWWIGLGLPLLLVLFPVIGRMLDRIDPGRRFERITRTRFPSDAGKLEVFHAGGLFADITETYTFTCSPAETERLVRDLKLQAQDHPESHIIGGIGSGFSPAARGWRNPVLFAPEIGNHPGHTDFLEMFVDETRTRVHIILGTI